MYRLTTLSLLLSFHFGALAQDGSYLLGARSGALSGASSTLADQWSLFNNPGATGSAKEAHAFVSYQNRYNIPGFQVIGGGFLLPSEYFNAGVKYWKFGDDLFSQQLAGLVFGNRFQMVSLGGGINVIQNAAEGLQTHRVILLEFGGRAEVTKNLTLAAHLFNLKHSPHHPATMKAGLAFEPTDNLLVNVEIEKQLDTPEKWKTGLEYELIHRIFVRTGIAVQGGYPTGRVNSSFGFGLNPRSLKLDYALSTGSLLGLIHEVSLSYQISPF